jgi:hypothetical protein
VQLRIFGFGDLNGGPWGVAWIPPDPGQAALLGSAGGPPASSLQLDGEEANEPWHLSAGATDLRLEGASEPVRSEQSSGFDQLCRVTGVVEGESGQRKVTSLGWRSARPHPLTSGELDSVRQVAGWFAADEGFALLAVRARGGRGQEGDEIAAALFVPAGSTQVADPRLSTTYTGSEEATRAGVELWVETEGESETHYPRRAIGEALAAPVQSRAEGLALQARPFRWYSGGREGAGLYLLGRAA